MEQLNQNPNSSDDLKSFVSFLDTPTGKILADKVLNSLMPPNWLRLTLAFGKYILLCGLVWFIYFLVTKDILDKITFSLILGAVISHLMTKYFSN